MLTWAKFLCERGKSPNEVHTAPKALAAIFSSKGYVGGRKGLGLRLDVSSTLCVKRFTAFNEHSLLSFRSESSALFFFLSFNLPPG